ncbi:MAG: hypothetical protein HRU19_14990 [Pseudobacteriovorax sp.]|nr:hypothetical protein [Pseudobacteriovorax sp.]
MKKKAWIIVSNRWNSAVTEYSLALAESLKLVGWEILFSSLKGKPADKRSQAIEGVKCLPFESFSLWQLRAFLSIYRSHKPTVVFVFGGPETSLAMFLPRCKIIRFRGEQRDYVADKSLNSPFHWHVDSYLLPTIRPVVCTKPLIRVFLGRKAEKYRAITSSISKKRPWITILGRLDPIKGHRDFFEIFAKLLQIWPTNYPRPLLKVIGEPANLGPDDIMSSADDFTLVKGQDWELITKRIDNIEGLLSQSDVGVISSLGSEVICRVAEEFLLCGCPIFVSGVGSLEDCLLFQGAGGTYAELTKDSAAQRLCDLLLESMSETPEDRQRRSLTARQYFSLEAMAESMTDQID